MLPSTSRSEGRFDWLSTAFLLGAVLLCYYLLPLSSLVVGRSPGAVLRHAGDPAVASAVGTSVVASLASVAVATVFGLPLAYWLARSDARIATVATALVVLPLVLPPVVSGMLLLTVIGPDTLVGRLAAANGVALTRSLLGVVLAQTFVASPFVVVTAKAAFEGVDRRLERAARSLGKDRVGTIRSVTLPLAWPGVVAGLTLAFARSMGEFGATMMLAAYPRTMPVQIWVSFTTLGLDHALPLAAVLVATALGTLGVLHALGRNPLA